MTLSPDYVFPEWLAEPRDGLLDADVAIIGTGMGGAAAAWALRDSGARVLLVERGNFLPREPANFSARTVFIDGRYKNAEPWYDARSGRAFTPGVHYHVGGNTKVYGACLPRFRERDFEAVEHHDGVSPAWPFAYSDIEPHYCRAEAMLGVHGGSGEDLTEPWRSAPPPHPPLDHEPEVERLAQSLTSQGLRPFHLPLGVDYGPGGRCVRCGTCDGFPCELGAKNDAETRGVLPALRSGGTRLLTGARVVRLETTADGRAVTAAIAEHPSGRVRIRADRFLLAAGAANTAALLLSSAADAHPAGLANSSGQVGRNYMVHNSTFLLGLDPRRRNVTVFQKTLGLNDWYFAGLDTPHPLGNVQMLGRLQGESVKPARPLIPLPVLRQAVAHSIDLYLTTEDLPDPDNRITVDRTGRITVAWRPNNLDPHRELIRRMSEALRRAGYPIVLHETMGIETNSHMCGTAVMGTDPSRSVLDPDGKAHDLDNLWITDSSGFPSSAALNPALTIAANALRIVERAGLVPDAGPGPQR